VRNPINKRLRLANIESTRGDGGIAVSAAAVRALDAKNRRAME
jgi:hypothetical protein